MLFVLRSLVYTTHALAAGVWIGGSLVYLVVITPALRLGKAPPEVGAQVARLFRGLVNVCIGALVVTGVFLVFDRLSTVTAGTAYIVVLTLKILVALTLFGLALYQAQEARRLGAQSRLVLADCATADSRARRGRVPARRDADAALRGATRRARLLDTFGGG